MGKPSLLYANSNILPTLGEIFLDAAVSEQHTSTARVTTAPIESGAVVADHIILEPDRLTIEGLLTDSPLHHQAARDGGGTPDPNGGDQSSGSRAIDAYEKLLQLLRDREPITVLTGLRSYRDMVLTSVSAPREADSGDALRVSLELVRVELVESRTIAGQKKQAKKRSVKPKRKDTTCECEEKGLIHGGPMPMTADMFTVPRESTRVQLPPNMIFQ